MENLATLNAKEVKRVEVKSEVILRSIPKIEGSRLSGGRVEKRGQLVELEGDQNQSLEVFLKNKADVMRGAVEKSKNATFIRGRSEETTQQNISSQRGLEVPSESQRE